VAYSDTILKQLITLIPRYEFDALAEAHHSGQKFRSFNRWSQFLAMLIGQLSGRKSLRDITDNLKAQGNRLYHLGMKRTTKATLARVNAEQPASLYQTLFARLLNRCQLVAPKHRFSFKGKLYLLDATVINLCLTAFPWAEFRQKKGAIKLHVGLDADGHLPVFMDMTKGKEHEISWARALKLPKGSFVCIDRGFTDYRWYSDLTTNSVFFVSRLKSNADVQYLLKRAGRKSLGVTNDQAIRLKGVEQPLRLVAYTDPATGIDYRFVTNAHHLKAKEITEIYKERWQIELFFKWIKQNLKIRHFLGTSENAVRIQVFVALIAYLLLRAAQATQKTVKQPLAFARLVRLNIMHRRSIDTLKTPPPPKYDDRQMTLNLSPA
jgi:hypothetical protein